MIDQFNMGHSLNKCTKVKIVPANSYMYALNSQINGVNVSIAIGKNSSIW